MDSEAGAKVSVSATLRILISGSDFNSGNMCSAREMLPESRRSGWLFDLCEGDRRES